MDTIKNAANQVSENFQGTTAEAKKEGNKQSAKDSNQSIGDRASAAASAVGNKADETQHDAKSEGYKQSNK